MGEVDSRFVHRAVRGALLRVVFTTSIIWASVACSSGTLDPDPTDADAETGDSGEEDAGVVCGEVLCPPGQRCVDDRCVGSIDSGTADGDADEECDVAPTGFDGELLTTECTRLDDPDLAPFDVVDGTLSIDSDLCTLPSHSEVSTCRVMSGGIAQCLVVVGELTVFPGATIELRGSLPVSILSAGPVVVGGDVSADADGAQPGAAGGRGGEHDEPGQGAGGGTGGQDDAHDGGGGGGGHGANGGRGGCDAGGAGGNPYGSCEVIALSGGSGGGGGSDTDAGRGGGGAGALQIFSSTSIVVLAGGSISASGGRGGDALTGSTVDDGGGGGGSGGTVLLEAPTVVVDGHVEAVGGDGGAGWDDETETRSVGGAGGDGNPIEGADGECGGGDIGGSGGGGSAGRIYIKTTSGGWMGSGDVRPELDECLNHQLICL